MRWLGRSRSSGQALTEFALVIPLFLIILVAFVDTGRLVYSYNTLSQAAREGARVAAIQAAWIGVPAADCQLPTPGCPADTTTFRQRTLAGANRMAVALGAIPDAGMTISCKSATGTTANCASSNSPKSTVIVGLSYAFTPIIGQMAQPIFGLFHLAPAITLSASSSMTVN